jgi:hypothetical protein
MSSIEIENITIFADGQSLMFQDRAKPRIQITLPASKLSDIIDFIRSVDPDMTERRRGFRVPVSPSSSLSVSVTFGSKSCLVTPLNLSLSGIYIAFLGHEIYEMSTGAHVNITLQLQDKTASLNGVVRRRDGNRYGIFFLDSIRHHELDPPDSLQVIYTTLERQWLRKKLRITD